MPAQSDLRFTFDVNGTPALDVVEFHFTEGLSETFRLELDLASRDPAIDFAQVLDQPARFTLWRGARPVRHVHGIVSHFAQGDTGFRRTRYRAVVEPRLARLQHCANWRIFQAFTVPQIAEAVLKAHGQTLDYQQVITNEHLQREYCVQAGDTDFDFIERILREEGFFFAFQHSADGHRLIHSDRLFIHGRLEGEPVIYNPAAGGDQPQPALRRFQYAENVRTARQTQRDYSFTHPRFNHQYQRDGTDLEHQQRGYERFDYPGRYKQEQTGVAFTLDRLRGHRRDARIALVEGDDPRLLPGVSFLLDGHPRPDLNRGWRPVRIVHHGVQHASQAEESADAQRGTHYQYTAELVPDDAEWRAAPLPRPRIDGPQPATVAGPEGEEIYTDAHGRVKVQFPWDREGRFNEHSSCWIRVAQNWAGGAWGHMAIPRIGQEVIVHYLDGDCDQPIIIGRTYNLLQPPPYELPRHKTRMTIKSQTHQGRGFNELRFEDEKDQEEIYVHAQKDQNIHINHDETTFVGNDRSENISRDELLKVGRDRHDTIVRDDRSDIGQDQLITVARDQTLVVQRTQQISITQDRIEEIGNSRVDKIAANHTTQIGGHAELAVQGHHQIQAGEAIRLQTKHYESSAEAMRWSTPGGVLTLDASGLKFNGAAVNFKAGSIDLNSGQGGMPVTVGGAPYVGEPVCVGCWLKAAAEHQALVKV